LVYDQIVTNVKKVKMATYIVTSDRLVGYKLGDIFVDGGSNGVNIEALINGGHISPQNLKKSAKTKDNETKD